MYKNFKEFLNERDAYLRESQKKKYTKFRC